MISNSTKSKQIMNYKCEWWVNMQHMWENMHNKSKHKEVGYICGWCDGSFTHKYHLSNHKKLKHVWMIGSWELLVSVYRNWLYLLKYWHINIVVWHLFKTFCNICNSSIAGFQSFHTRTLMAKYRNSKNHSSYIPQYSCSCYA